MELIIYVIDVIRENNTETRGTMPIYSDQSSDFILGGFIFSGFIFSGFIFSCFIFDVLILAGLVFERAHIFLNERNTPSTRYHGIS